MRLPIQAHTRKMAVTVGLPVPSIAPMSNTCTDWKARLENKGGANAKIKCANPIGNVDMIHLPLQERQLIDRIDRVCV